MALFLKILCDISKQAKFIEAGPIAAWLWLAGVGHCRLSSTDGFIHKDVVPGLVPKLKSPYAHAAKLVEVGLWEDAIGGYRVHDYLAMNPSKAELAEMKRVEVERKQNYRANLSQRDRTSQDSETPTRAGRGRASSPSPSASVGVVDLELSEGDSEEISTTPPAWRKASTPAPQSLGLINGAEQRRHGAHIFCGRVCVTIAQHVDFVRRLGAPDEEARLTAWYPTVMARYEGRPIGDDMFAFWNHEFAAWVGTVTSKPSGSGKGNDSRDAMQRAIQRRQGGAA